MLLLLLLLCASKVFSTIPTSVYLSTLFSEVIYKVGWHVEPAFIVVFVGYSYT